MSLLLDPVGERPWLDHTFGQALEWAACTYADAEAVVDGAQRLSFAQLAIRVRAFSQGLIDLGVGPGDRVALWMDDRVEWLVARWAVPAIGAVLVPINTRFRDQDVAYVLGQSECSTLIVQQGARGVSYFELLGKVEPQWRDQAPGAWQSQVLPSLRSVIGLGRELPASMVSFEEVERDGGDKVQDGELGRRMAQVGPQDVAQILYTSGTTSFPKGAMVCHGPLLQNNWFATTCLELVPSDRYLSCVPLFTATGTFYTLAMWLSGATMVIAERFEPRLFCELVQKERITVSFFVDTIVQDLKGFADRTRYDLSSLRTGTGAPLPTESFDWVVKEIGVQSLVSAYGMSETSNAVVRTRVADSIEKRSGTNGRPVDGVEIRIADVKSNETLPAGTVGEVCIRGYVIMKGYYKMPEETSKTFDEYGWLHSGDLGELDQDGYLVYRGRVKEMIKPGGFNVATQEIELFLKTYPGVKQAVVVGVPDVRMGEIGYAYIELQPGQQIDAVQLQAYCREHIAGYKVPRYIEFITEWPMTGSQKIRKLELKARAGAKLENESGCNARS
jgi:fatty-acyl-CoA synthase